MRAITWFKVDDGFWSHPKTATLSDAAVTLWVRAGAYSCQHLTDGRIQRRVLRLVGVEAAADELVEAHLWIPDGDGWRFHDWDEYQETSEAVKKRREDARERQNRARERAASKRRESQGESRVTDGVTNGVSSLYPTRPDPTRPPISNEIGVSLSPDESDDHGTLIPDAWRPNQKHIDKAASLRLDVQREYQRFRQRSIETRRRMTNWNAGFTNWLRKAAEFNQQRQTAPAPTRKQSKAAQNAAEYRRLFGGDDEHAGSIQALDSGIGA